MLTNPVPPRREVRRTPRARAWWPLAVGLLAIVVCVSESVHFISKTDDAYIAFVYAQNWVQGHGVVFNLGERVEGYTCFLWVVLSALGLLLGVEIGRWSAALGIAAAAGAVLGAWRLAHELLPERVRTAAVLAAIVVGAYPPLAWWAASGMETALFTCLVTLAIWLHVRDSARSLAAPVCLALASMTRPEGWLLSALLCADALRLGSRRAAARYIAVFLGIFGPYFAWRFWYYGYPLPNTFYAKVGYSMEQMTRGRWYLLAFLLSGRGALLLAAAAAAAGTGIGRRIAIVYAFLFAYITYVVLVGGDFFQTYRFFVPIVPVLAALALVAVIGLTDRLAPRRSLVAYATGAAAVAAFLAACLPIFHAQQRLLKPFDDFWLMANRYCRFVKAHTEPDDAVAAIGIGILKFCSGRRVIDMAGLTDAHIAHAPIKHMGQGLPGHEKYDSAYVLSRRPKYILIPRPETFDGLSIPVLTDMWEQPLLKQHYAPDAFGYQRID